MHNAQAPKSQASPLLVVAGIVLHRGDDGVRVLLARRHFDAKSEAGKWEFPGGKVEPLEHPEETLRRELKEELDLDAQVGRIFDVASLIIGEPPLQRRLIMLCYLCEVTSRDFKLLDVSDARWVTKDELDDFDYAVADHEPLKKLKDYLNSSMNDR